MLFARKVMWMQIKSNLKIGLKTSEYVRSSVFWVLDYNNDDK